MTKRMLIDSSHAEETRVVLLDGNRLEDYDFETAAKRQLKGNIYLAKIVRVEPSLQAAFVEYGGNRHGFLAFGEIHPDYFQIPVADRQRLIALHEAEAEADRIAEEQADRNGTIPDAVELSDPLDAPPNETAVESAGAEGAHPAAAEGDPDPQGGAEPDPDPDDTTWPAPGWDEAASAEPRQESHDDAPPPAPAALEIDRGPTLFEPDTDGHDGPVGEEVEASGEAETGQRFPDEPDEHDTADESEPEAGDDADTGTATAEAGPGRSRDHADRRDGRRGRGGRDGRRDREGRDRDRGRDDSDDARRSEPESLGGERDPSADREDRRASQRLLRHYKIQEVIRRRQVILVQVVKEERGSKGAALTSYISLAGRFCVLMPNSPRGGGVSRKITSASDRKRLKEITAELDIPRGMAMIVRTAGGQQPRPEIRRDCEYLLRLWDDIRDTTMASMAPSLIYEEASLIKRAIRDSSGDVDEIVVDGGEGWRAARDFMGMLMPNNVGKVRMWRDSQPLFAKHNVEGALDAILSPNVQLRSGGYLVINQTEALVAIDVNSGRSTRERGIEETALRTNLEAADEVARQLRLRDLAGLIVIDFIDMENRRHNAMVEKRMKDALRADRARIQVGAISHFGLMELSRQRMRPSIAESSFVVCSHCNGTGLTRGIESAALHVLRAIEAAGSARDAAEVAVHAASSVALYVLNHKRAWLDEIEARLAMQVRFEIDESLAPPAHRIVRTQIRAPDEIPPESAALRPMPAPLPERRPVEEVPERWDAPQERDDVAAAPARAAPEPGREPRAAEGRPDEEDGEKRKRRRRRRRGGKREGEATNGPSLEAGDGDADAQDEADDERAGDGGGAADPDDSVPLVAADPAMPVAVDPLEPAEAAPPVEAMQDASTEEEAGKRRKRSRRRGKRDEAVETDAPVAATTQDAPVAAYTGPTPADPFGGTFDIFDVLAASEDQYLSNPASSAAAAVSATPAPAPRAASAPRSRRRPRAASAETAAEAASDAAPAAPAPDPVAPTVPPEGEPPPPPEDTVPIAPEIVAEAATPTEAATAPAPDVEPEPEQEPGAEPRASAPVQPILLGSDGATAPAKRGGWWRR